MYPQLRVLKQIRVKSARWQSRPTCDLGPHVKSARRRSRPAGDVGPVGLVVDK